MNTATTVTNVAVFPSRSGADAAITALYNAGFSASEIGVVTRDGDGKTRTARGTKGTDTEAENAGEGATAGAVTGAGIGALIGAGVLAGVVPVIGPALFAGTLGVLASNAAGGAAVAGIVGALMGWGMSEDDANYYQGEVVAGRTIVTVTSAGRSEEARSILRAHGGTSRA